MNSGRSMVWSVFANGILSRFRVLGETLLLFSELKEFLSCWFVNAFFNELAPTKQCILNINFTFILFKVKNGWLWNYFQLNKIFVVRYFCSRLYISWFQSSSMKCINRLVESNCTSIKNRVSNNIEYIEWHGTSNKSEFGLGHTPWFLVPHQTNAIVWVLNQF